MMDTAKGVHGAPMGLGRLYRAVRVEKYGGMLENLSHTDP